ncbi:right-handed parallel beta-helix repeat-containing protein [Aestuariibacter sp. AA17]|uniref:Right-handed parallel beta-helix repeat-containing protein n=1 Tax=Fluctibacter corallii TaxID=2984329 RepID=A0ABT3A670_9ALTE|nr:right-handed parallel beta-helix repeat-containing protein [Aestuariibacter sp. AA17]MCV2884166.1 right-handed parallel beta-helix repeat-containing protein [Aestuariibacter sp. AA17]
MKSHLLLLFLMTFAHTVFAATPSVPSSLTVPSTALENQSYTVSWGASSGTVTRYDFVGEQSGYLQQNLSRSSSRNNPEGRYCYKVRGCNGNSCSAYTSTKCVNVVANTPPPPTTPSIPTGLSVATYNELGENYTVSWNSVSGTVTQYDLVGEKSSYLQRTLATSSTRNKSVEGEYCYKVRACNGNSCSNYSSTKCTNVIAKPQVPGNFNVPSNGYINERYRVSWDAVSGFVDRYELVGEGSGYLQRGLTTYSDRNKSVKGEYRYKVRACNAVGCSNYSAIKSILLEERPPAGATSYSTLLNMLNTASHGDTVNIAANFSISVSNIPLIIPAGVSLEGNGRTITLTGTSTGQKLALFEAMNNASVNNITLTGPYFANGSNPYKEIIDDDGNKKAVVDDSHLHGVWSDANISVTNSTIQGFTYGITAAGSSNMTVSNSYIYNNFGTNLGYGVHVSGAQAHVNITDNEFRNNRHAIAANGEGSQSYTATRNKVRASTLSTALKAKLSHSFDIHGDDCLTGICKSGSTVEISNNIFQSDKPAIRVRGIPSNRAIIRSNTYPATVTKSNALQADFDAKKPNADFIGRCDDAGSTISGGKTLYAWLSGTSGFGSKQVISRQLPNKPTNFGEFDGTTGDEIFFFDRDNYWRVLGFRAASGEDKLQCGSVYKTPTTSPAFLTGQFGGAGSYEDLFRYNVKTSNGITYREFQIFKMGYSTTYDRSFIDSTVDKTEVGSQDFSQMHIGDFDGDGIDEVLRANGSRWDVFDVSAKNWSTLRASNITANYIKVGKFDVGAISDVFYSHNGTWYLSNAGTSTPVALRTSSVPSNQMAVGDFDGDGVDDVFYKQGTNWYFYDVRRDWIRELATNRSEPFSDLMFADINGDGKTDVLIYH